MKKQKITVDTPCVEERKRRPIIKPNPNCIRCKGKGVGDAALRAIVACPHCLASKMIKDVVKDKTVKEKAVEEKPLSETKYQKKAVDIDNNKSDSKIGDK